MEIDLLILEGKALAGISCQRELLNKYDLWCSKVKTYLDQIGCTEIERKEINVKMHYVENEYSPIETIEELKKSLGNTIRILEEKADVFGREGNKKNDLSVVERILENFYMYYHAMYKNPVHKKGTLTLEALSAIQIGNEYDLQRMLYSLLLPLFPTSRQEVYSDNGYAGMRADIYLNLYNLIIETKCTRESMAEKQLIEEMVADAFHYQANVIYFFIYDRVGIIKNPEAFKEAFARGSGKSGKTVKVFLLQPREL